MNNLNQWLIKISLGLLATLSPVRPIMIAVFVLVIFDFITGIWAAIKRDKPITSFKMRRTIVKGLAYQAAIIVAFIMETYLLQDIPLVKVVGAIVALTEGKSFFENLNYITGVDFTTAIIEKIQGKPMNQDDKKPE